MYDPSVITMILFYKKNCQAQWPRDSELDCDPVLAGADIHKTRYRTDVLDFNKRYRSVTGHYHVYEREVPDIVLQHEKCIGHSVKVHGKCPLSGMDISPWLALGQRFDSPLLALILLPSPWVRDLLYIT